MQCQKPGSVRGQGFLNSNYSICSNCLPKLLTKLLKIMIPETIMSNTLHIAMERKENISAEFKRRESVRKRREQKEEMISPWPIISHVVCQNEQLSETKI